MWPSLSLLWSHPKRANESCINNGLRQLGSWQAPQRRPGGPRDVHTSLCKGCAAQQPRAPTCGQNLLVSLSSCGTCATSRSLPEPPVGRHSGRQAAPASLAERQVAEVPNVRTSKQTPHTRTGLLRLNLRIGMSFSEHLAHRMRPQWRQWCFLVLIPNLFPHSRQMSPSDHGGSLGRKSAAQQVRLVRHSPQFHSGHVT